MPLPDELPAGLLDVRAIAFDVDGTLAGTDHLVSPRTLRALAELRRAGIEPVVVTGRIIGAATDILAGAGIDGFAIASGGAVAVDTRAAERLHTATMEPAEVAAVVDFAESAGQVEAVVFTAEEMVVAEGSLVHEHLLAASPDAVVQVMPELPREGITKAMLFGTAERLDQVDADVRAALPRMVRSMDTVFEAAPAGADKWIALRSVLERLGVDRAHVAGLGDGENDVAWLSQVGWPVAMANARQPVKALARLEIGHHGDEGAAEFVEALLAAHARRASAGRR